jgi:hypothetical protein
MLCFTIVHRNIHINNITIECSYDSFSKSIELMKVVKGFKCFVIKSSSEGGHAPPLFFMLCSILSLCVFKILRIFRVVLLSLMELARSHTKHLFLL